MIRIWHEPDGSVKITRVVPEASLEQVAAVLRADGHISPDATWEDLDDGAFERMVATLDPAKRHKWRRHPSGRGLHVDPTVPDPPDPDKELLATVAKAKTVGELKQVLATLITQRRV